MSEKFADLTVHAPWFSNHPVLTNLVEEFLGILMVRSYFSNAAGKKNPFASVIEQAEMSVRLDGLEKQIPKEGPCVIAANHSHGGPDAIALSAKCLELRPDALVLANAELMKLPGVDKLFLPVSILQEESAAVANSKSLRTMLKHVRGGGCVVVFPAGRVAYWQDGEIQDPPWNDHVVALIQRMKATVVPVWFFGGTPPWMQICSKLSAFVRTALIPRGLREMKGKEIVGRVGEAFPSERMKGHEKDWLRKHLESLREIGN